MAHSALASALVALLGAASVTAVQAACFSTSRPILPSEHQISPTLTNGERGLALVQAVQSGRFDVLEALVRAEPDLLSTRTVLPEGTRPYAGNMADLLTIAIASCNPNMLGALLELGADPNGAIPGLALTYAALADDQVMTVMLLQAGASPDAATEGRTSALREVLFYERSDAVAVLAQFGANVNQSDMFGRTPLDSALSFGDWASAKVLMDAGANPWQVANQGTLPAFTLQNATGLSGGARAVQEELLARTAADAPIWPPPPPMEVVRNVQSGTWPTDEMRQAGFVVTEGALRSIRMVSP
ncbi:MAG: hypothetical protein AAF919_02715 [Pseudomonadota bacterium]